MAAALLLVVFAFLAPFLAGFLLVTAFLAAGLLLAAAAFLAGDFLMALAATFLVGDLVAFADVLLAAIRIVRCHCFLIEP